MDTGTTVDGPRGTRVFVVAGYCGEGYGGDLREGEEQARDRVAVISVLVFDLGIVDLGPHELAKQHCLICSSQTG